MLSLFGIPIRRLLVLPALAAGPVALAGQTPADLTAGAEAITAADLGRHIGVIAADSMHGRDTPSPGLEATARYVAGQFQQLGLTPAGGEGSWFQRYPIPSVLDLAHSRIVFAVADSQVGASFANAVWLDRHAVPKTSQPAGVVVAAGRLTGEVLRDAHLAGKVVLYVAPNRPEPDAERQALQALRSVLDQDGGLGLITLSNLDSLIFAWHLHRAERQPEVRSTADDKIWSAQLRPEAAPGLQAMLAAQGLDLNRIRTETAPFVRELPSLRTSLDLRFKRTADDSVTAPNVIAVIDGSDSLLRREYVVFVAHMDHTGSRQGQADSIANGADDNASGVAGLLALAKAFSQPGARPARSIAFIATSGGAKNFWGSNAFLDQVTEIRAMSQFFGMDLNGAHVPIIYLTAAFNLDMIGRHTGDSVTVDGLGEVDLPTPPVWVAAAHPELHLTVVDGGTATADESDHFAFVQQAVPSLSFHNDSHDAAESIDDSTSTIDTDLEARILQLVFYLGEDAANTKTPARWNSEGRQRYLGMFTR